MNNEIHMLDGEEIDKYIEEKKNIDNFSLKLYQKDPKTMQSIGLFQASPTPQKKRTSQIESDKYLIDDLKDIQELLNLDQKPIQLPTELNDPNKPVNYVISKSKSLEHPSIVLTGKLCSEIFMTDSQFYEDNFNKLKNIEINIEDGNKYKQRYFHIRSQGQMIKANGKENLVCFHCKEFVEKKRFCWAKIVRLKKKTKIDVSSYVDCMMFLCSKKSGVLLPIIKEHIYGDALLKERSILNNDEILPRSSEPIISPSLPAINTDHLTITANPLEKNTQPPLKQKKKKRSKTKLNESPNPPLNPFQDSIPRPELDSNNVSLTKLEELNKVRLLEQEILKAYQLVSDINRTSRWRLIRKMIESKIRLICQLVFELNEAGVELHETFYKDVEYFLAYFNGY
jgi:hypothetical protein